MKMLLKLYNEKNPIKRTLTVKRRIYIAALMTLNYCIIEIWMKSNTYNLTK